MTVSRAGGLPPFRFVNDTFVDQLVCPLRTFVRAVDGDGRELLAPMLAWTPGPPAIGDTGDNSPSHMLGSTWLLQVCPTGDWVLYQEERGRLTVVEFDDPPSPVGVAARRVSVCFDQAARVVLAWEESGVVRVRRWDATQNKYIQNVSFSGVDPCVVIDASWSYRIPDSDLLLFYLSPDRERVLCRVQRDVYAVEYEIWDYETPVVLDRVIALPYKYQVLVSDASGAPLPDALISELYPVALTAGVRLEPEFLSGAYRQVAYPYAPQLGVQLTAEFVSGALTEPVVKYRPTVGVQLAAEFASGAYFSPVVKYQPIVAVELAPEFTSGALDEIGVRVAPALGVNLAAEFIGGTYEPA